MIDLERSRECRIKRANTDWWINEKSMVGANGHTYITYITDMGEIHVKELDAKCSRVPSKDVTLCRLNRFYSDEHNAPSICVMNNGRIVVAYTGHGHYPTLSVLITERPYDLDSFGPERVLEYRENVTYAQLFENTARKELWLFTRVRGVNWEFRCSKDEGRTWSTPSRFLSSQAGGLFYFNVRKLLVPADGGFAEQWFFALYGHPGNAGEHVIRSGIFNSDGWLLRMDGSPTDVNLFPGTTCKDGTLARNLLTLEDLPVVYEAPSGATVRLLEVTPTLPYRVGFAAFELDHPETITYYIASLDDEGKWRTSAPIAKGGEFLSDARIKDGSQTYVGGMACYYGVGEYGFAGRKPSEFLSIDTNRVYIARADQESRVLESYVSLDGGLNYRLEQVIRRIPKERNIKIWRPTVPIFAQDNLPVYWHEGCYSAYSGGWHCDAVMLVEYDD